MDFMGTESQSLYSKIANFALYPVLDAARRVPISHHLRFLEESQYWSRDQISAYQDEKLHRLIQHAYENVPYYRRVMDERGLTPRDIVSWRDLPKLPILTKDIIRTNQDALIAQSYGWEELMAGVTGGTTGEPMHFFVDRQTLAMNQAAFWRGLSWAGLHRGERLLMFTGGSLGTAPQTWTEHIKASVARQFSFPAFEVNREHLSDIVVRIRRVRPKAIKGYVSTLLVLARLLKEAQIEDLHVPIIFTTAEKLWPDQAEEIGDALGGEVFDYYGCGEVNSIGFQAHPGGAFFVSDEKVIIESLPLEDGEVGGPGRFLLTELTNYAFPFIRYENGDAGVISRDPGGSEFGLSRITALEGRVHDFITTTSGELLAGEFFPHLFRFVEGVEYFQVVQDAPDNLVISVVVNENYHDGHTAFLTAKIKEYAGEDMHVDFQQVDEIPRTRAGKLRVTVSYLD
jgi:phenylacetate-CoA ligase